MPFNMQGMAWVILIIVALLIFGGNRLAGAGKNAGRAIREFKDETRAIKADEEAAREAAARRAESSAAPAAGAIEEAELIEPAPKPEQKPDPRA